MWVIGPAAVPEVLNETRARNEPELAVLSAMAHGQDADPWKAAQIAYGALPAEAEARIRAAGIEELHAPMPTVHGGIMTAQAEKLKKRHCLKNGVRPESAAAF